MMAAHLDDLYWRLSAQYDSCTDQAEHRPEHDANNPGKHADCEHREPYISINPPGNKCSKCSAEYAWYYPDATSDVCRCYCCFWRWGLCGCNSTISPAVYCAGAFSWLCHQAADCFGARETRFTPEQPDMGPALRSEPQRHAHSSSFWRWRCQRV